MNITDDYFVGFVEGEGCFYVSVVPSKETRTGWQVIHFFKVSQNPRGLCVLKALQERLNCGYIKSNASTHSSDKSLALVVRNITDLQTLVIPFFSSKLIIKKHDFDCFEKIVQLVSAKKHQTYEGMKIILELSRSMNTGKKKFKDEDILNRYV